MEKLSLRDRICVLITSVFGIGYSPFFPGTLACIAALWLVYLIKDSGVYLNFTLIVLVISFVLSSRAERIYGEKDSKKIVIDDFAGLLITFLFIPRTPQFMFCGFFLFRALDMVKIPPANKIEKYPGALGVVGDDLVAGIYANLILHFLRVVLRISS